MKERRTKAGILNRAHEELTQLYKTCEDAGMKAELAECIALLQQVIELSRKVSAACQPRARGGDSEEGFRPLKVQ